jgi:hypothetical protein
MNEAEHDISGLPLHPSEPTVAGEMIREMGIAPALVHKDSAHANLVEAIRQQTDEIVGRAKAAVKREHEAEQPT